MTSSRCHSAKNIRTTVGNFIVAWKQIHVHVYGVIPLRIRGIISLKIRGEHGIQCMPCFPQIISEMLPEIPVKEK